jgi:hypothetical protein
MEENGTPETTKPEMKHAQSKATRQLLLTGFRSPVSGFLFSILFLPERSAL